MQQTNLSDAVETVVLSGYSGPYEADGSDLILECQVTGAIPPATIEWTEDGTVIPRETGTTLTVARTVDNDNKVYRCRAYNEADRTGKSDQVTTVIQGRSTNKMNEKNKSIMSASFAVPPSVTVSLANPDVDIMAGTPFDILCEETVSDPTADLAWFRDGVPLGETGSSLTVDPTGEDNRAVYKCEATNGFQSSDSVTIEVLRLLTNERLGAHGMVPGKAPNARPISKSRNCRQYDSLSSTQYWTYQLTCTSHFNCFSSPLHKHASNYIYYFSLHLDAPTSAVVVNEGPYAAGTISLSCETDGGNPEPTVAWYVDGALSADSGSPLSLDVGTENSGMTVSCDAMNSLGMASGSETTLIVVGMYLLAKICMCLLQKLS